MAIRLTKDEFYKRIAKNFLDDDDTEVFLDYTRTYNKYEHLFRRSSEELAMEESVATDVSFEKKLSCTLGSKLCFS